MSGLNLNVDPRLMDPINREIFARIGFADPVVSFAPYFALAWIDVFLLGVAFVVFEQWWHTCRGTDRKWSRYIVYWIMVMAFAFSRVYQAYMLYWFAYGFGRYVGFIESTWVKVVTPLGNMVRIPAMLFYLHRAYTLVGKRIWIVCLVALPIAYTGAAPIAQFWLLHYLPYSPTMQRVLATSSACEVAVDVVITLTISIQLYRSRTGWSSTDRLITRLLFTIAETQTPPSIMASLTLILFYTIPNKSYQLLVIFSPKVTVLCILFTLLSRVRLAEQIGREGANNQSKSYSGKSSGGTTTGTDSSLQPGLGFTYSQPESGFGGYTSPAAQAADQGKGKGKGKGKDKEREREKDEGKRASRVGWLPIGTGTGQSSSQGSGQTHSVDLGGWGSGRNARDAVDAMEMGHVSEHGHEHGHGYGDVSIGGAGRGEGEADSKQSEEVLDQDSVRHANGGSSRVRLVSTELGSRQ